MRRLNTQFPFALMLSSALLAVFAGSFPVFAAGAALGSLLGAYSLTLLFRLPRLIRFTNTVAITLLLNYGLGTVIYLLYSGLILGHATIQSKVFPITYGQDDISLALAIVYAVCGLLFYLGRIERPIFFTPPRMSDFTRPRVRLLMLIGLAIMLAAFRAGDMGFMGVVVSRSHRISALGSTSLVIATVMLPLALLCVLAESRHFWKSAYYIVMLVSFVCLFFLGRRVLIFSLVTTVFAFALTGRRIAARSLAGWARISACLGGIICLLCFGFLFFYSMRLASWASPGKMSLLFQMNQAVQILSTSGGGVKDELAGNVAVRPFELSYLAGLVHAHKHHPPLYGGLALYSLEVAIPSFFYHEKTTFLPPMVEEVTHPALGLPVFDGPNTIVTASLNDFGFAGVIIYPILLVLVYALIARLLASRLPPFLFYLLAFRLIYMSLSVESALPSFLTVGLRDLAIITLLFLLIWKIPYRRATGLYYARRISQA